MIEITSDLKEKCQDCSLFTPDITTTVVLYAGNELKQKKCVVFCKNHILCDEIEKRLKGVL